MIDSRRLERLAEMGRISRVVRKRKGQPVRAILHRMPGEPKPSTLRDYMGTKYSVVQRLREGNRCYRLRSLGDNPREERDLAPEGVRAIFLRVVAECLSSGHAA
jgi:hypothetical protein